MRTNVGQIVGELVRHVSRDDIMGLAAELAYRFFLALFPFAIFLAALGGFVARGLGVQNPAEQLTNALQGAMPSLAVDLLAGELRRIVEHQEPGLLSFGAISALFFATAGTNSLLKGMNRAFETKETRSFFARYLLSLALTLLAGAAVTAALLLFLAGQVVGGSVAARLGLDGSFWSILGIARWPVAVILLTAAVVVLYRFGPNTRAPLVRIVPGAAAFAIAWLVAVASFGAYVGTIGSYGATYGALAGVAILLIWLYISSFVLLAGVELTAVLTRLGTPEPAVETSAQEARQTEETRESEETRETRSAPEV